MFRSDYRMIDGVGDGDERELGGRVAGQDIVEEGVSAAVNHHPIAGVAHHDIMGQKAIRAGEPHPHVWMVGHDVVVELHPGQGLAQRDAAAPTAEEGVAAHDQTSRVRPVGRLETQTGVDQDVPLDQVIPPAVRAVVRDPDGGGATTEVVQDPAANAGLLTPPEESDAPEVGRRFAAGGPSVEVQSLDPHMLNVVEGQEIVELRRTGRWAEARVFSRHGLDNNRRLGGARTAHDHRLGVVAAADLQHVARRQSLEGCGKRPPRLRQRTRPRVVAIGCQIQCPSHPDGQAVPARDDDRLRSCGRGPFDAREARRQGGLGDRHRHPGLPAVSRASGGGDLTSIDAAVLLQVQRGGQVVRKDGPGDVDAVPLPLVGHDRRVAIDEGRQLHLLTDGDLGVGRFAHPWRRRPIGVGEGHEVSPGDRPFAIDRFRRARRAPV